MQNKVELSEVLSLHWWNGKYITEIPERTSINGVGGSSKSTKFTIQHFQNGDRIPFDGLDLIGDSHYWISRTLKSRLSNVESLT